MPGTDQAVHAAIEQDDATELKTLLDRGSSSDGGLYLAGKLGRSECVQLLLDTHAAIDQPDSDGVTPLLVTCDRGHSECVQLLLAAHAVIDRPSSSSGGATPLLSALQLRQDEVAIVPIDPDPHPNSNPNPGPNPNPNLTRWRSC